MGDSVSAGGGFPGKLVGDIPDACKGQFPAADDYFLIQDDRIDPAQP